MPATIDDRCDYQLDVGLPDQDLSTEPCGRPVWEDHDRCIWHAKVEGKTTRMLEDAQPTSDEDLNGAYLREAELSGIDWFAGRSLVGADLTEAHVNNADFREANLEGAIFTNADLRRSNLERALLNEAVFTDVHIGGATSLGERSIYESEDVEPVLGDDHPLEAAAWAYRQLERVYQDNGLPYLARQSYNREKDARRKHAWADRDYSSAIKRELAR